MAALQDDYLALLSVEKVFETACWLGLEDCLQLSKELFKKWMADPEIAIPHPIQRVALCNGIALGTVKEWDFLFSFYINITKEKEERGSRLIPAMSCSKEPWILNRFMEYVVTVNPNPFNETNVIEAVAASEVGQYVAKDFLLNNWPAVSERYGPESVDVLVWIVGRTVSTDLQIMELLWFLGNVLDEHQKIAAHAKLQAIKTENLKNKKRIARMAEWLWKNT